MKKVVCSAEIQFNLKFLNLIKKSLESEAPKSASLHFTETFEEDEFGAKDYSQDLKLKPDHFNRPLWVVSIKQQQFICKY